MLTAFSTLQPTALYLHYRDPVHCAENLRRKGDREELQNCFCFAVQQGKKFFIRFKGRASPIYIRTRFYLSVKEVEKRGAEGPCDAAISSLEDIHLNDAYSGELLWC